MLVTQQPVLRDFWYPVMPCSQLLPDRPRSFQLLGQKLAIWLDSAGRPSAIADRCCHRSAQLSQGVTHDGCIRCPYHGWSFDRNGACVNVPQFEPEAKIPASYRVPAFRCAERYGYVWVCLSDQPRQPIPPILEAEDPSHRLIPQFDETWHCGGLRMMENAFDNAHFSFVHADSFGDKQQPIPASLEITPVEQGLVMKTQVPVANPPQQQKNLGIATATTLRTNEQIWYMPFCRTLKITYPNGLMHLIFTAATPISDHASQIIQFCVRNDTEADAPAADIIAFDRQVTLEDKAILESTDYDTPLALSAEQHMPSDQPGILMRKQLSALLKAAGETEQCRAAS
ncbi:aromatic ring-hydroxylating dioxygenase subunit alpha [Romeria aff. gracilis LEGE 07310]|uniref:Aromatic ring-hydroxylating dioxygenase subunit alpha n=1 Tax=Vasconcelosia minhoensis LEGE 07310 TaxID=915328 RepID=A0A8J7AC06_9CYAN|nr:aromatic ring-hydroxylating dioxygenase subunit alpha [Romeria gracilis]MBE9080275.1 aromatic ring-hydroxylating dioxygenase subunit alpha [Romeria aff. gracilis LEGE 07310]